MATSTLLSNMMTGNQTGVLQSMNNLGTVPVGNATGSTNVGPSGTNTLATGLPGGVIGSAAPVPGTTPIVQNAVGNPEAGTATNYGNPTATVPSTVIPGSGTLTNAATAGSNSPALTKQLDNIYGSGVGGEIANAIANLGSTDSSYMQAYTAAMAPQNAENLATLNTTLGNSGVSANSSTAAIANADYQSNITSQEGLQEAQLQQTDEQNLLGLLTSTEGAANKQASTSVLGDIGDVLGSIGSDVGNLFSHTDLSNLF